MKMPVVMLSAMALGGCAQPAVQDMRNGQHSLTATAPSGGFSGSHEEAIERANDYCARSGQQAVLDGFYDKPQLGPAGEHTTSLIFSCTARPKLQF
jgi:hypothetical protein